ncbi:MAG: DUF1254 domain-containing protein [Paracoccaceae bacterium]
MKKFGFIAQLFATTALVCLATAASSQTAPEYAADVPSNITVPDRFETRLGVLEYSDGLPTEETVALAYDALDLARGMTAFLDGMPAASTYAMCRGLEGVGLDRLSIGIFNDLYNARSLLLTPNTTTIYMFNCTDLSKGPVVLEVPPGILGLMDDVYMRYVTDIGNAGPDKGEGGKFLIVPPGYDGPLPESGYFIVTPPSNMNWFALRAFYGEDGVAARTAELKQTVRVYPWDDRDAPAPTNFVDLTDKQFNTIHANDFSFFEEMKAVVDGEVPGALPEELMGTLFSLGIRRGEPFEPDQRLRDTLGEAVALGTAAARSLVFAPRSRAPFYYDDGYWKTAFVGGSHEFQLDDVKLLDARSLFHYYATGTTPAMVAQNVGVGSQYALVNRDSDGNYMDGAKTYSVTLPPDVPINNYWSFVVYDTQTRSLLETDQKLAGVDSKQPALTANEDGSFTIWFAPEPPEGKEGNWIQTIPGKSWTTVLRLYGPLEPWFDGSWRPGEIELRE